MNLSKSKYTRYCQCPKMLWLDTYKRQLAREDAALQRRFDEGNEVGDIAMGLLGDYVETTAYTNDGRLDIPAMLRNTKKYLMRGAVNICEAAFSKNRCYCAVDILHKTASGYEMYEVKSSAGIKDVYLLDCAYQKWVLESSALKIDKVFIVLIDGTYMRQGDLDISKLFKAVEITDKLPPYYAAVNANVQAALAYISRREEPHMDIGLQCFSPYECLYFDYCARNLPKPNVFDLYGMGAERACGLYKEGIVSFGEVAKSGRELTNVQRLQVQAELCGTALHVDRAGVRAFISALAFPLCVLDIATFRRCVPPYDGLRPFQSVPFAYSLHYITGVNQKLQHVEFLAEEGADPRRAMAERLVGDVPAGACLLVWDRVAVCTVLAELAQSCPDLSEKLLCLRDNVRGLAGVFRGGLVYAGEMGVDLSADGVLSALFKGEPRPDCPDLINVRDGEEAAAAFWKLRSAQGEERVLLRAYIAAYCRHNAAAMALILRKLKELCA